MYLELVTTSEESLVFTIYAGQDSTFVRKMVLALQFYEEDSEKS